MINTPRKNGYSFKYGTLFYVPFFSCHLGISETFIRLYIYAIDFLLISSIFSNLSLKIFFIINRVLEHTKKNKKMEIEKFIKSASSRREMMAGEMARLAVGSLPMKTFSNSSRVLSEAMFCSDA